MAVFLKRRKVAQLLTQAFAFQTDGYWMFWDTVDGEFLTDDVTTLWQDGAFVDVPLLVGAEPTPPNSGKTSFYM